uniref:Putative terminase n=1 Tax=viral metagenome TaxID=1070528 RepID=A0A6H1ZJJ5_9ZZZZ
MARRGKLDKAKAQHAIDFIQPLTHVKAEWAGKPFILFPWEKRIVTDVFGTLKPDGYRQYNTVYIEIPKKNGKSPFAAALILYLLCGDGEEGAEIYGAATAEEQANIVYDLASKMVMRQPTLRKRCKVLDSIFRIVYYPTGSFYQVVSSEPESKHGFNTHGLVIDELHAHKTRKLFDVLTDGAGDARRQPLFVYITTAGVDRNSIGWEMHERARQVLNGTRNEPTLYPVIYGPPDDDKEWDWEDERNWKKVNPSLGRTFGIEKLRTAYRQAKGNAAKESNFQQLRLDVWVKSTMKPIRMADWDECAGEKEESQAGTFVPPGKRKGKKGRILRYAQEDIEARLEGSFCYAGLDLSSVTDLTAGSLVFPGADGTYDILMRYWIPEDTMRDKEEKEGIPYRQWVKDGYLSATPGNVVDYAFIRSDLNGLRSRFRMEELAYDRWGAWLLVQQLMEDGFVMEKKEAGNGHPLIVPFGQGYASMSPAVKELLILVLGRKIRHWGNPVLRWNVDNLVLRQDPAGNLKPDKEKATNKIDGVVALVMALDRATRNVPEAESIYEHRGVTVM